MEMKQIGAGILAVTGILYLAEMAGMSFAYTGAIMAIGLLAYFAPQVME